MSMTPAVKKYAITAADIMPMTEYEACRRERQRQIAALKKDRRVEVGPFCTLYFENYATMWHQIHEMLYIERGGEAQIQDELDAYNPLIPQGNELTATVMLEIEDATRRQATLMTVGGIENHVILVLGGMADGTIRAIPDPTRENTSADGKASSVQFVRFVLTPVQSAAFVSGQSTVMVGFDHANYSHLAMLSEPARRALAEDLL